jgi:dienelactone hydrolase
MPVLVWGEGACSANGLAVGNFLAEIASHGIFVIASGAPNGQGSTTSQWMKDSISWAVSNGGKGKYTAVDSSRIAAAGWSCGGLEAYDMSQDSRVSHLGIFSSGQQSDQASRNVAPNIKKPIFFFLGGSSDIAYQNVRRASSL